MDENYLEGIKVIIQQKLRREGPGTHSIEVRKLGKLRNTHDYGMINVLTATGIAGNSFPVKQEINRVQEQSRPHCINVINFHQT